ncbi:DUF4426 domain-containing protein [Ferrimonas marina]|uniref:DUF4426 domain-containing protein n=1 Tax=Ferrimonas marina TaxID=299255 RepID=A0A1M5YD82_9GAMM|nr:DUF4426 domain-containing protein [Ferrimonas marina]SHI10005.1 protein of unknown function [Ferrimonas marina]
MFRALITLVLSGLMLLVPASAEQKMQVGKYAIHYVSFGSTFLTPEVAKAYGISRSRYTGLVNVSVIDTSIQGDTSHTVAVSISGNAKNLLGSNKSLDFKEVREGDAIYYIAEVGHRNEETYTFDIQLDNGSDLNTRLQFQQKFYVD